LVVNGDFFMPHGTKRLLGRQIPYFVGNSARVCGWAMTDGNLWSERDVEPSLVVHKDGKVTIGSFRVPPRDAWQIVSGSMQIVSFGRNTAAHDDPAPHTAVGIDADNKKLVLMVVDGRRPDYSVGLSTADEADEMIRLGCRDALNLDGGGSSTLAMRNPVTNAMELLNRPSDGHDLPIEMSIERPVANTFGVRIDNPATQPAEGKNGSTAH
jgi:exopolysaccharide biosynthesis protein